MAELIVRLDGNGALAKEAAEATEVIDLTPDCPPIIVAGMAQGTVKGNTAVAIGIRLPDGKLVIAQTTLALFLGAASALRARYGDK